MAYHETDGMFEIKYIGEDGKKHTMQVYAESKSEAQREFNADKEPGEKLLSVKKIS
jgi:hypothetical protein